MLRVEEEELKKVIEKKVEVMEKISKEEFKMLYGTGAKVWKIYIFVFQAEDSIRDLVRSRGLGDVYKRQV